MPSVRRRAFLSIAAASVIAGCTGRFVGDDENTSPAERRVSTAYRPGSDEWITPTRSFANDVVSPSAAPPRDGPEQRWSAEEFGSILGVAVADGVVFAGGRDGVEARQLEDGSAVWSDAGEESVVAVVDGRCYTIEDDTLVARKAESGEEEWRHESTGFVRSVLEADGTVYYTARGDLHGLHADTGERRWTIDGDGRDGTLALADGELHWASPAEYRIFAPEGGERPEERTTLSLGRSDPITEPTAPAVVDDTIALGGWASDPGRAPVRSASRRGIVWQRPFEPAVNAPAVLEDRLLVTGYDNGASALEKSTVAALDPDTGDPLWETTVPEPVGPPAVADGTIYAGGAHPAEAAGETGHLFAIDVETGDLRWELDTDGSFAAHPLALVEDAVVLGTRAGVLVLE